jgi:hypothetical protein
MDPHTLRRSAGWAGLAFIPLFVASIVLVLPAPMPDKSTAEIVAWWASHREVALTSGALTVLSTVAFLWFLGYLHHSLSTPGAGGLSSVVLASGLYLVTVGTVGDALPPFLTAVLVNRPGVAPDGSLVHTLVDFAFGAVGLIGVGFAVFLFSLGLLFAHGALQPRWASWVAYVGAALTVIGAVFVFYVSKAGKPNPVCFPAFLIGTVLFLVVVGAVSIEALRSRTPEAAPARSGMAPMAT